VYFHNLKFDGSFLVDYAVRNGILKECLIDGNSGMWYFVKVQLDIVCEFRDTLKKFPQSSINDIARIFNIQGKTDKPDFEKYRPNNYKPTKEEIEYCKQDSHIIAVAMKHELDKGNTSLTLATDCFKDLKSRIIYDKWYPRIDVKIDTWLRPALRGGYTYLKPEYKGIEINDIWVHDENSEYPYVTSYKPLPYWLPFQVEEPEPEQLYVVKFKSEFELRKGFVPTIELKYNFRYGHTEYVTESKGETEICLTSVDYELFKKHYKLDYEIDNEYIAFNSKVGICKPYVDYWYLEKVIAKLEKKDYEYWISKIRNNNSWGKLTTNPEHTNLIPYLDNDDAISYNRVNSVGNPLYLPHGLFVTAWARWDLITEIQNNYDIFIYGDTDSIHTLGKPKFLKQTKDLFVDLELVEILEKYGKMDKLDDYVLGAWKQEGWHDYKIFPRGKYLKSKMYLHADENYRPFREFENPLTGKLSDVRLTQDDLLRSEIKAVGMTDEIKEKITWDNFNVGSKFDGMLKKNSVKGGCLLRKTDYTIK